MWDFFLIVVVSGVVVVQLSCWVVLQSSLCLAVLVHCLFQTLILHAPIVQRIPRSCRCQSWAWVILWGSQLILFRTVWRILYRVVCTSQIHWLAGFVCKLWLLNLSWCWWVGNSGLLLAVRVSHLVQLCLLHLVEVHRWVHFVLLLLLPKVVVSHCQLSPYMLWTCISTLRMFRSLRCKLVVWACICWCCVGPLVEGPLVLKLLHPLPCCRIGLRCSWATYLTCCQGQGSVRLYLLLVDYV